MISNVVICGVNWCLMVIIDHDKGWLLLANRGLTMDDCGFPRLVLVNHEHVVNHHDQIALGCADITFTWMIYMGLVIVIGVAVAARIRPGARIHPPQWTKSHTVTLENSSSSTSTLPSSSMWMSSATTISPPGAWSVGAGEVVCSKCERFWNEIGAVLKIFQNTNKIGMKLVPSNTLNAKNQSYEAAHVRQRRAHGAHRNPSSCHLEIRRPLPSNTITNQSPCWRGGVQSHNRIVPTTTQVDDNQLQRARIVTIGLDM